MHHLGIPRHTQSILMNEIFVIVFPEIPVENCVVGMLITGTMWDVDLKKLRLYY